MDIKDLVLRISFFRNKAELSARELSLRIGKHGGYINKLESKDFNLPAKILLEIIDALGVTCEEFFSERFMSFRQDKEILKLIEGLSAERKNSFIDLMKNSK